jgi:uncharacterized protein
MDPKTAITSSGLQEPLTEAEFDQVEAFLARCESDTAMNFEELDGFFSALIAGPEIIMPSEYLPKVFGGELSDACPFATLEQVNEILGLMWRHWNNIAGTLAANEPYTPVLWGDENGEPMGNDWAYGFIRGVAMQSEAWSEHMTPDEDDPVTSFLVPMLVLAHEHDPDPSLRPPPISAKQREDLLVAMGMGLMLAYRFFRDEQENSRFPGRVQTQRTKNRPERALPVRIGKEI